MKGLRAVRVESPHGHITLHGQLPAALCTEAWPIAGGDANRTCLEVSGTFRYMLAFGDKND